MCPLSLSGSAYCDRCDFNPSTKKCGSVSADKLTSPPATPTVNPGDADLCWTQPTVVYRGLDRTYSGKIYNNYLLSKE